MKQGSHGGDTYGYGDILDLSANVHPFGTPADVVKAVEAGAKDLSAYPDPQCRDLRQAIALRDGVAMEQIVCGNGAADLIVRLVRAIGPKQALLTAPTFGEYGQALAEVDCQVHQYLLRPDQGFAVGESFLTALEPGVDLAFLCTPNNPTGQCVAPDLLERIAHRARDIGCYLVVDECFLELCQRPHSFAYLLDNPSVVLLRAFTKSYGMAGLRMGYCLSGNDALRRRLEQVAQPWSVSTLAQLAGIAACGSPHWPLEATGLVAQVGPTLVAGLEALGAQVWPGEANYLLFRLPGCTDLREQLLGQGVMIRSCANYQGLGPDYYRIAIPTEDQAAVFLQAMATVVGGG